MGNFQRTPVSTETITDILDKKRGNLLPYEAEELYWSYYKYLTKLLFEEPPKIRRTLTKTTSPVTIYRQIGYEKGNIVAFRLGTDPKPYLLFEGCNCKFKDSVRLLKQYRSDKPVKQNGSYELLTESDALELTLATPQEATSRLTLFYWVLKVESAK